MYSKTRYNRPFLEISVTFVENHSPLEGLLKKDNISMLEHSQHFYLAHNGLFGDLIFIRLLELLDGHYRPNLAELTLTELPGILMLSFVYDTVGSLANDAYNFILIHLFLIF
jgi:hypothetical protein